MSPLKKLAAALTILSMISLAPLAWADADKLRTAIKQNSRDTSLLLERQEKLAEELDQLAADMATAAQSNDTAAEEARLQLEIADIEFKQNPNPRTKRVRDQAAEKLKALGGAPGNAQAKVDIGALREKHTAIRNELSFINEEIARLANEMGQHRKALKELPNPATKARAKANTSSPAKPTRKQSTAASAPEPQRPNEPAVQLDENFVLLLSAADVQRERARIKAADDDLRILRRKGLSIETWQGDSRNDSNYMMRERAPDQFFAVLQLKKGLNVLRSGANRWVMEVPPEDDGKAYVFTLDASEPDNAVLRTWAGKR